MAAMNRAARSGFTVVEILVVILLLTLLLAGLTMLLGSSSRLSRTMDQSNVMAMEASTILNRLRADILDSLACPAGASGSRGLAEAAGTVTGAGLTLTVHQGGSLRNITWNHDPGTRLLRRGIDGTLVELGQGLVASFAVSRHWLGPAGEIHAFPEDPELADLPNPPPPAEVLSLWYTVDLTVADPWPTPRAAPQRYRFRMFPVLVNRQFRTIWKED